MHPYRSFILKYNDLGQMGRPPSPRLYYHGHEVGLWALHKSSLASQGRAATAPKLTLALMVAIDSV